MEGIKLLDLIRECIEWGVLYQVGEMSWQSAIVKTQTYFEGGGGRGGKGEEGRDEGRVGREEGKGREGWWAEGAMKVVKKKLAS